MEPYSTTANGWRCTMCGAWIIEGLSHVCIGTGRAYTYPDPYTAIIPILERIAAALEKLAAK